MSVDPSVRAGRQAVASLFFLQGFVFATWASRIPQVQAALGLSNAALGSVLLALPVGLMVSLPPAGWAAGRLGSGRVVRWAMPAYAGTLVLIAVADSGWQLAATLFLFGVTGNLNNIAINAQAVAVEARLKRSVMASFHGVWSLAGFAAAAVASGYAVAGVPLLIHFAGSAGVALLLLFFALPRMLPDDVQAPTGPPTPLFTWPDATLRRLSVVAFCGMMCEGAMFDWSGVYFEKVVQVPAALTTLGYTAFMGTMAAGRFVGDGLAQRLGTRRLIQLNGSLVAGGLLVAVALPYLPTATLGFLIVGAGVSTVVPMIYGLAGRSGSMSPGAAIAAVSSVGFLGFLLGPPLIGFVAEAVGLRWAFAGVAVLGAAIVPLVGRAVAGTGGQTAGNA